MIMGRLGDRDTKKRGHFKLGMRNADFGMRKDKEEINLVFL